MNKEQATDAWFDGYYIHKTVQIDQCDNKHTEYHCLSPRELREYTRNGGIWNYIWEPSCTCGECYGEGDKLQPCKWIFHTR